MGNISCDIVYRSQGHPEILSCISNLGFPIPDNASVNELGQEIDALQEEKRAKELCFACEKRSCKLWRCSLCRSITYCSKKCQRKHWKVHKKKCQVFNRDDS